MTSFLIVSQDQKKRTASLQELCDTYYVDSLDSTILNSATNNKSSIGIEEIKQIQKKIFLKPIKSQTKAIIIDDAQLLTPEAQNALLKVLEEPPDHTIIILAADTIEALLPTIRSRCKIIILKTENRILSEKEQEEFQEVIDYLPTWGIGERLKKAESLSKDKDKTIAWIEKIILVLREEMIKTASLNPQSLMLNSDLIGVNSQLSTLNSFQSLHTLLKTTNVNPRFAIEQTLLNLL